jgi:hypothetical protein
LGVAPLGPGLPALLVDGNHRLLGHGLPLVSMRR